MATQIGRDLQRKLMNSKQNEAAMEVCLPLPNPLIGLYMCVPFLQRRKWQPTPVFLPGESQGRGARWASVYGVAQSRTRLKWLSSSSSSSALPVVSYGWNIFLGNTWPCRYVLPLSQVGILLTLAKSSQSPVKLIISFHFSSFSICVSRWLLSIQSID